MRPRDLATIRLVTRRYRELQGLRLVLVAGVYLGLLVTESFADFSRPLAAMLVCAVWSLGESYLNRYYRRRFGVVEQPVDLILALFALALVIVLILSWAGSSPHPILAVFAAAHLWIVVRDFPIRTHHLLGSLAAASAVAFSSFPQVVNVHPALILTLYPASLVPIGLLDHHLLGKMRARIRAT